MEWDWSPMVVTAVFTIAVVIYGKVVEWRLETERSASNRAVIDAIEQEMNQ